MTSDPAVGQGDLHLPAQGPVRNVIVVRRETKKPILLKVLPVHGATSAPFLGAKFILTLTDLEAARRWPLEIVAEAFTLTTAEAKVASLVAAGSSPRRRAVGHAGNGAESDQGDLQQDRDPPAERARRARLPDPQLGRR